jgi:acetyl esterase/lipase
MTTVNRRTILTSVLPGSTAFALGASSETSAQVSPSPQDSALTDLAYVHPELRRAFRALAKVAPVSPQAALEQQRKSRKLNLKFSAEPVVEAKSIPGARDAPDVDIYIITPALSDPNKGLRPAILHMHGGGFMFGTAQVSVPRLQVLARELDCIIVSVDYRLAPETRFPGALEDNYAALKWLHTHAENLGVDAKRIAILGESAGGGHAAMLAIAARDRAEVPIIYQALIYPMLDDRTGSRHKVPPHRGEVSWTAEQNRFGWGALLGKPAGSFSVPYGSVPARVADLRGLPPAFIGVGTLDLFFDEDVAYAKRLIDAGVLTELHIVPGAFHSFESAVPAASLSRRFHAELTGALAGVFAAVA